MHLFGQEDWRKHVDHLPQTERLNLADALEEIASVVRREALEKKSVRGRTGAVAVAVPGLLDPKRRNSISSKRPSLSIHPALRSIAEKLMHQRFFCDFSEFVEQLIREEFERHGGPQFLARFESGDRQN